MIYCTEEEKYQAIAEEIEQLHKWDTIARRQGNSYVGTIVKEDRGCDRRFNPEVRSNRRRFQQSKIQPFSARGRPVLVGTTSIEKSERLSGMFERRGIQHEVLNAKHHKREAEIVAQAGRIGAVTIATNMAGRGTDIVLGGNPETMAWAVLQDKYETRLDVPREEWDQLVGEIEVREGMREEGRSGQATRRSARDRHRTT